MLSILRIPKLQLIISLLLIYLTALIRFPTINNLQLLFFCVILNVAFDLLLTYIKKRTFFIPYAAIATGLIMSLIINQSANLLEIAFGAALAMGLKNFLRISERHIFNPVASGLFLYGLIFNQYIGWWGVSFQKITQLNLEDLIFFLVLLSPAYISFFRLKKYYSILSYIAINAFISQIFFPVSADVFLNTFSLILNPPTLFFALVMLPEPMTSPVKPLNQILYGGLVAIVPFMFSLIPLSFAFDPLLFGLLLGNLIFFKNR